MPIVLDGVCKVCGRKAPELLHEHLRPGERIAYVGRLAPVPAPRSAVAGDLAAALAEIPDSRSIVARHARAIEPQIKPDRAPPRAPGVVASGGGKRPPNTLARAGGRASATGGPTG